MKINKYNKPKDNSGTGRISGGGTTTIINGSTSDRAAYSEEAGKLSDTHLIFGQPFNGTQDVAGDLSNVQNITATGGDIRVESVVDADGKKGGNIYADGDIAAGGNVSGVKFIGDVDAKNVTTDNITAGSGSITDLSGSTIQYDEATFKQALIDALSCVDITTENLTVTKQAHFFELIIDKIKAAGGAILLTPADGFRVDKVLDMGDRYRLLWRSTDGEKAISNMWRVGDQAICQTFNKADVGTNYNVSNKYYWALVTAVGSDVLGKDEIEYHYIDVSKADYDGTLNPEEGDEIAMLGYRGTDDTNRQSAIYLAAYSSLDPTLTAPLFCHYKGINDFNLSAHKFTWFAANGNEIRGNLRVESGQTLKDYLDNNLPSAGESAYLHTAYSNSADGSQDFTKSNTSGDYLYIGLCSNFKVDDADLTYKDYTWSRLKGDSVKVVTTSVEYAVSNQGTDAPTSGWQTTIPYVPPANYLWTRNTIFYSDGTKAVSYMVVRYGANGSKGDKGDKGDDGADGSNYTENLLYNTRYFDGDLWVNREYWQETGETFQGLKVLSRDANSYGIYQKFQAVAGETYTFSAWLKSDGGDARYYFTISGGGIVTPLTKDVPESAEWTRQAVSFKCTQSGEIACRVQKATGTGAVYVAGYKLERGTNANTVWTPAATEVVGQDAERYFLIANTAAFSVDSAGNRTPDSITARAYKQVGSGAIEEFYGAAVRVLVTDIDGVVSTYDEDSGEYTITADDITRFKAANFIFQLIWDGQILDSITVPVINDGKDADYYKLVPIVEQALVQNTGDLDVHLRYNIAHIKGKSTTYVVANGAGYKVRFKGNTESLYHLLSVNTVQTYYSDTKYQEQYVNNRDEIIEYLIVELINGSTVLDRRIVTVTVNTAAILEITDNITARVSKNERNINTNTNSIAQLQITANSISSTVSQHTTNINNLTGKVDTNTKNISTLQQTANGLKSTVESHTTTLGQHTKKISEIEQTAENIRLQVEDVALKIDGKKIVLDGNTEVNGTVNVNKDGTGFRLNGSNGETFTIGSNDIGNYTDFENKTVYNWLHNLNNTIAFTGSGRVTKAYQFNNLCTTLKVGQRLRITNLGLGITDYNLAGASVSSLTVSIFYGNPSNGNQVAIGTTLSNVANGYWYQGKAGLTGSKSAILDYTATKQGDYYVRINGNIAGNSGGQTELNVMLGCEISLNAFGNLTYNGFGFNFGGGKVAFISDDAMVFKMGANAGLKITDADGLQRLVPESYRYSGATILHRYVNSAKWIGVNDYVVRVVSDMSGTSMQGTVDVVSPKDEMLVVKSISKPMILVLPAPATCPGKSYLIKNYSSSDELYISGGSLQTSSSTSGNIIKYGSNGSANDWCKITYSSGTTTYWQLLKCYKHSHQLVSDGTKWIDNLLSN